MSVTLKASRLIVNSLKRIGVLAGAEVPTADMAADALDRLNAMIDSWAIQRGTIQGIDRNVFTLVVGQGGPTSPYVIGTGSQFALARPVWIVSAAIIQGTGQTLTEYPMNVVITADEYTAICQKNTRSTIPTVLYYEGVSSGNIFLWPVPSSAAFTLAIYSPVAVSQFADYNTTSYTLASGYQLAIETNLAIQLLPEYPRAQPDPLLLKMATESLAYIKRLNIDPGLLQHDRALLDDSGGYGPGNANWLTGP